MASKHAVEGFTLSLMEEVEHLGVSAHLIRPSEYGTELLNLERTKNQWLKDFDRQDEHTRRDYGPWLNVCKKV